MPRLFPTRGFTPKVEDAPKRLATTHETKAVPVLSIPIQLFFGMGDEQRDDQLLSTRRAFKAYALVYACMRFRYTKLIEAPLWITQEREQEEVPIEDLNHPLEPLLKKPNPDMTMGELLTIVSLYEDCTGAAILVKNRDGAGRVVSLYPFARDEFSVSPANGRLFGRFDVTTLSGTRQYPPEDVIYFRLPSTTSLYENVSPVDAALLNVNLGYSMFTALRSAIRNAVRPGAIFTSPKELDQATFDRLKAQAEAEYAGIWNRGKTMLVEGGLTMEKQSTSLGELELGPVSGDVEAAICQCFGLHPALVGARIGLENSGGFADLVKSATELFYDVTQLPRWAHYEEKLTEGLLVEEVGGAPNQYIRFMKDKVRSLQTDMTQRVAQAKAAAGFWKIDEQRAWTMKDPLDNGEGDVLSKPAGGPTSPDDGDDPEAKPKAPKVPGKKTEGHKSFSVVRGVSAVGLTSALLASQWTIFSEKASAQERPYVVTARRLFAEEKDDVIAVIERATPAVSGRRVTMKAGLSDDEMEWQLIEAQIAMAEVELAARYSANGKYHEAWRKAYEAIVRQTFVVGTEDVGGAIGLDFDLDNPGFQSAIQKRVKKLAGNVTKTTLQQIRDVIAEARQRGDMGLNAIVERIQKDVFGDTITRSRAETIARTETVGALNESSYLAAIDSEVMESKHWLSEKDPPRARPSHEMEDTLSGWIPLRAKFPVTGKTYPHDGVGGAKEDVNCRCSLLFSDLSAAEANTTDA